MMEDDSQENSFHFKQNALAMHLQQRYSPKVLAEQRVTTPLNTPGSYFPQVQRSDRSHKEKFLSQAMHGRPERDLLVQKHVLEGSGPSITTHQKDIKAQLVDDLNDKLSIRPGVIELVERNIIPVNDDVQEAIKGGHLQYRKIADFSEEDSTDPLSPDQHPPQTASPPLFQLSSGGRLPLPKRPGHSSPFSSKNEAFSAVKSTGVATPFTQSNNNHPYLSRQTSKGTKVNQGGGGLLPKLMNPRKKPKEKQKFKKYKYHQYVPSNQQGKSNEKNPPSSQDDTPYSRLLQQQQLYLQYQIMNNQINSQRGTDNQQGSFNQQQMVSPPPPPPLGQGLPMDKPQNASLTLNKLDEMKVSELKEELKMRGQKLTGTKEVLVERLKPFCLSSDNVFLPSMDNGNSNFAIGNTGMMAEGQPTQQQAYYMDPNLAHSHKMARMPTPERHQVVVKQEKLTMPTYHNPGDAYGPQAVMPPVQQQAVNNDKDKLLEKQQKQIHDLKKMVQLHRTQLQHIHKIAPKENAQVMTKPAESARVSLNAPQLPIASSNAPSPPVRQVGNNQMKPVPAPRRQNLHQPKFDQTHNNKLSPAPQGGNGDMDDIMELLNDNGELPSSPVVTRVLLNDHKSYHGLNSPAQGSYPHHSDYAPPQLRQNVRQNQVKRMSQEYASDPGFPTEYSSQVRQNQMKRMSHEYASDGGMSSDYSSLSGRQNHMNRMSQEYASDGSLPDYSGQPRSDLAKMLVESSGDALMDTANFPFAANRYSNPNLDQHTAEYSGRSARNSFDSGVMYSTPNFSPMDTSGNVDVRNELRLSTSSLDSVEPTLNAISLSPATPPRHKHHHSSHPYRQRASPRVHHSLVKSASQELLSTNQNQQCMNMNNNPMNKELGWLDLTLSSAVGGPPSPGNPFQTVGLDQRSFHHSQHSNCVSTHGSHEGDLNFYSGSSSGTLNFPQPTNNVDPQQFDSLDGFLSSNFNS